jgi:hypothetical protein
VNGTRSFEAEASPSDALLLRMDPAAHQSGLDRLAAAALSRAPEAPRGFRPPALTSNLQLNPPSGNSIAEREGEVATASTNSSTLSWEREESLNHRRGN